jgi:uncharacterized protein YbjT (DUF2867 family)
VTGATGNIGSATLEALRVRHIEAMAGLSRATRREAIPPDTEWRLCNFDNEEQVAGTLRGIDSVFLLIPFEEDMLAWGRRFADAVAQAGVGFVLRLSGLAAAPDSQSKMGRLHGQIDAAIKESGVALGVLRCNAFMQNFSGIYGGMIRNKGALYLPEGSARLNFIDTRDIGEVAASILADPRSHAGKTYDLDGPEALGNEDAVRIIAAETGTAVEYRAVSAEQANETYRRLGISDWRIDVLDSLASFVRAGGAEQQSPALGRLLERHPRTFQQFARDHREIWLAD